MPDEFPNVQWAYIILELNEASVMGTNDIRVAKAAAADTDNVVVHVMTNQIVTVDEGVDALVPHNIPEQDWYKFD